MQSDTSPVICVAEPSEPVRRILALLLEGHGYTVIAAPDAIAATYANTTGQPFAASVEGTAKQLTITGPNLSQTIRKPFDVDRMLAIVGRAVKGA